MAFGVSIFSITLACILVFSATSNSEYNLKLSSTLSDINKEIISTNKSTIDNDTIIYIDNKDSNKQLYVHFTELKDIVKTESAVNIINEIISTPNPSEDTKHKEAKTKAQIAQSTLLKKVDDLKKEEHFHIHKINTRIKVITWILIIMALALITVFALHLAKTITLPLKKILSFAISISNGDLSTKIESERQDEFGQIIAALNNMNLKLREVISSTMMGANNIATASEQLSATSEQLSQGANEQSASVEEISSTVEEMTINIEESKENANMTERIAQKTLKGVFDVNEDSQKAVKANENISDKINIIQYIAAQTNILALNAAVEAARIGDYGRGFAVVAGEVRKLADNSKDASIEISNLSSEGLDISKESNDKLTKIVPGIKRTSMLLQEVAAASTEQANGVMKINNAIQTLNTVALETAAASEELASNSQEMASQAITLKESMQFFKF